ncbi:MAG TPA: hypothetical protein PLF78_07450 [Caulobacter sp.]|jgi:hypothetical protein|nr:hypothetical protein [Caulobacter sp.]
MATAPNPAQKRYLVRFMPIMAVYVVAIILVSLAFDYLRPAGPLAWALALLPGVPIIGMIAVMGLYLKEEGDEFVRSVLVEAMLWGVGVTLAAMTVWGLLEFYVAAPRLPAFFAFPIFCGVMGLAQPFVKRRYR